MKTIVIDGKTYTKATDLAKDLGYTSDYVGQLCRAGKVEAERVGRSWYVVAETIKKHQSTRYRSNKAKSAAAIKAYRQSQERAVKVTAPERARHIRVHTYESDDAELIPEVVQKPVIPAQSTKKHAVVEKRGGTVRVVSYSKNTTLAAHASDPVQFTGRLTVAEVTEAEEPAKLADFTDVVSRSVVADSRTIQENTNPDAVTISGDSETQQLYIQHSEKRNGYNLFQSVSITILTVAASLFVVVTLLSFESSVLVTDGMLESSYKFNFRDVATALKSLIK